MSRLNSKVTNVHHCIQSLNLIEVGRTVFSSHHMSILLFSRDFTLRWYCFFPLSTARFYFIWNSITWWTNRHCDWRAHLYQNYQAHEVDVQICPYKNSLASKFEAQTVNREKPSGLFPSGTTDSMLPNHSNATSNDNLTITII